MGSEMCIRDRIIEPTFRAIRDFGEEYIGFLYAGLMIKNNEPFLIEYNVRMGDPETEVVIPRIKSDLLNLFKGIGDGTFSEKDFYVNEDTAVTVLLVSGGYPEAYEKGKVMSGIEYCLHSLQNHSSPCLFRMLLDILRTPT